MTSVFLYHVVGDLTVGKPELLEFLETETVETATKAIGESMEGGIPVWRKPKENVDESRQQRFVGILNSLDIVAFLARDECLNDQEKAMRTPVSQVAGPNSSLLKEVDPATRLIDALEMMKQGVRRLLVSKGTAWKGMSKRFSVLYNGKWLTTSAKFCCLSREDMIRFLIGCLGALAPLPLLSLSSLDAINSDYLSLDVSLPASEAACLPQKDPGAVAITELITDGRRRIVGEISACLLWKCNHTVAAWAFANFTAGQFVTGVEDSNSNDPNAASRAVAHEGTTRRGKLCRSSSSSVSYGRNMYWGRSVPLTCCASSSLAAVMAQMLSHRTTHVWVTEADADYDYIVVGLVGYADILAAVTRSPAVVVSETVLAAASIFQTATAGVPETVAED